MNRIRTAIAATAVTVASAAGLALNAPSAMATTTIHQGAVGRTTLPAASQLFLGRSGEFVAGRSSIGTPKYFDALCSGSPATLHAHNMISRQYASHGTGMSAEAHAMSFSTVAGATAARRTITHWYDTCRGQGANGATATDASGETLAMAKPILASRVRPAIAIGEVAGAPIGGGQTQVDNATIIQVGNRILWVFTQDLNPETCVLDTTGTHARQCGVFARSPWLAMSLTH